MNVVHFYNIERHKRDRGWSSEIPEAQPDDGMQSQYLKYRFTRLRVIVNFLNKITHSNDLTLLWAYSSYVKDGLITLLSHSNSLLCHLIALMNDSLISQPASRLGLGGRTLDHRPQRRWCIFGLCMTRSYSSYMCWRFVGPSWLIIVQEGGLNNIIFNVNQTLFTTKNRYWLVQTWCTINRLQIQNGTIKQMYPIYI